MTVETMIARQTRIERQETLTAHQSQRSRVDAHAATRICPGVRQRHPRIQSDAFRLDVRSVDESGAVMVHAVYEPEQEGSEDSFEVVEGTPEEASAAAIAERLGMTLVGAVFNITTTKPREYTMSAFEVRTMARLQAKHGKTFVTAVVMMLEDEDEGPQVSFEPFQVSDQCVKLTPTVGSTTSRAKTRGSRGSTRKSSWWIR